MWRKRRLAGLAALLVLLMTWTGCAAAPKKNLPAEPGSVAVLVQSDTALFQEAYALLSISYSKAREAFSNMVRLYPKSKWRPYAETYMKLLDDLHLASDRVIAARQEERKAQQETEETKGALDQSKKAYRLLQERLQAETARLQQENEQLKNDLQRLKQLEIDLQKRERSLR